MPCEHGQVRSFAIALGCLAWMLSCFDAVSYYRAGTRQRTIEVRLRNATADAVSVEAYAGRDSAHVNERLKRDGDAIARDRIALDRDGTQKLGDAQDKQALAADEAALAADRMMQYTVENFARTDPNPRVEAAVSEVDVDRRMLADTVVTRARDVKLSHALIALWTLVAGTALLAFRRKLEDPPEQTEEEEDSDGTEGEPSVAEGSDGTEGEPSVVEGSDS